MWAPGVDPRIETPPSQLLVFFIFVTVEEVFVCSGRGLFVRRPRFEVVAQTIELANERGQLAFCIFEFARGDEAPRGTRQCLSLKRHSAIAILPAGLCR
jgi:hypothetical protein